MAICLVGRALDKALLSDAMASLALPWSRQVNNVVDHFIGWVPWARRTQIVLHQGDKVVEYAGVYLFADFGKSAPKTGVSYEDDAIFYVGETGRSFGKRWYEYERTNWFRGVFGKAPGRVWVAALPTRIGPGQTTPEPLTTQFRLYTERRIIWEHAMKGHYLRNVR